MFWFMIGEAPSVVVSDTAKLLYIQKTTKKYSLKQPINPKHKLLIINAVVFRQSNTSLSGGTMLWDSSTYHTSQNSHYIAESSKSR